MSTNPDEPADHQISPSDIAIIGMACRFPEADNPSEFWSLLRDGREALRVLADDELRSNGVSEPLLKDPNYVKAGMFLRRMDEFDPAFFGFSPLDARILDPQHRHFLECTWEALEDAGYDPARFQGSIGVFAGSGHNSYLPYNLLSNPDLLSDVGLFLLRHTGNDKDFLVTRASYLFDLKGPSINVQTACSTSLVAVHLAAQSLLNGECDMALAGGVTIELPHGQGYLYKEGEILSRDGHCRPFDSSAGGTVFGSGVGVVMLKRLDQAVADGDNIHAVIKASAINNDGAGKVSYLAPSVDGQAASAQEALIVGGIAPESVSYIETHGTGTQLGDPIEVEALTQAYGASAAAQSIGIGSVKSNIGHLDTAAGVASLIKVILALKHRQIPASLNYERPNRAINLADGPFYVNAQLRNWESPRPLRAAVSSLGVGGTNAHVIVEQAPLRQETSSGRPAHLLLLSARTETALAEACARQAHYLRGEGNNENLGDVEYTLISGRRHFRRRIAVVATSSDQAAAALEAMGEVASTPMESPETQSSVAFMFAGGGAQYPDMGRGLYDAEPLYRSVVDELLDLLSPLVDFDPRSLLFPAPGFDAQAAIEMERPSRSLPLLFITQFAQARLWESWGVSPSAFIGHSMGENTAACLAGVFSPRDALGLVALRGRLFESLPEGGMLSVNARSEELEPMLRDGLGIAARNAPDLTVVSGPLSALRRFEVEILDRDLSCQRIRINVAAHSGMLAPILKPFGDYLRSIPLRPPQLPFVSNLTGSWITPEEATDPEYWVRHLRETVRFADGVQTLLTTGRHVLLEVGPGRTLATLASLSPAKKSDQAITSSLRHPEDHTPDLEHMLAALGQLWQGNTDLNWEKLFAGQNRRRVSLPTYAFDHARYWIEPGLSARPSEPLRKPIDQWFYVPVWTPDAFPSPSIRGGVVCVMGSEKVVDWMRPALRDRFERVIEVITDDTPFEICGQDRIRIGRSEEDYRRLVRALATQGVGPIHFYLSAPDGKEVFETLSPLFYLARAVTEEDCETDSLIVITHGAMRLPGDAEPASPVGGSLSGAVRVVAAELQLPASLIDLPTLPTDRDAILLAAEQPAQEGAVLAYRSGRRLKIRFENSPLTESEASAIRQGGVYVITGGFGGLGLAVAEHLARTPGVKLALIGRHLPPAGSELGFIRAAGGRAAEALEAIERLRTLGAETLLMQCDVSDRTSLGASLASVGERWGRIDGVFHAAGNLSDALLPMQDELTMRDVLAPKVEGTRNLFSALMEWQPDFLLCFSSTSALSGVPGQFAYAAANSFEDTFADARSDSSFPVISVNWPAWQRVGMTAALAKTSSVRNAIAPEDRSLLVGKTFHYLIDGQDWIVAEHRTVEGTEVLPGAAFVEIAAMAAEKVLPETGAVVLRDLVLIQPLVIAPEQRLVLSVVFDEKSGRFSICSSSDADAAMRSDWIAEHAQGSARRQNLSAAGRPARGPELSGARRMESVSGRMDHPHMRFGPRWSCIDHIEYGGGQAAIEVRLDDQFAEDLDEHFLHPALLDMATGSATGLIADLGTDDFYVPQSYGEVVVHGPLPSVLSSRVRYSPLSTSDQCVLDIQLSDTDGVLLLEINGFTLRRLRANALSNLRDNSSRPLDASLEKLLSEGIEPEEGLIVLEKLLATRGLSRVLVAPYGPEKIFARSTDFERTSVRSEGPGEHMRPALRSTYLAPSSELEQALAAIWQEGLGIDAIGLNDDFFELGGHSLLMIQLVNRARKRTGVRLPLKELYSRPTISGWVELAGEFSAGEESSTDRPALKRVLREAYRTSENVH